MNKLDIMKMKIPYFKVKIKYITLFLLIYVDDT